MALSRSQSLARSTSCPWQLVVGVFCLAAMLSSGGPVAASVALAAWGAARLAQSRRSDAWLAAVLVVYGGLTLLAVVAQCEALLRCPSTSWRLFAGFDSLAAVGCLAKNVAGIVADRAQHMS